MKRKRKPKLVSDPAARVTYAIGSPEARAIKTLHDVVGRTRAFFEIWRAHDGSVTFAKPMTEQIKAFALAPRQSEWVTLTYAQSGSWEELLGKVFDAGLVRQRLRHGSKAPWPWPPSVDGRIYTDAGGPPPLTEADIVAFANEGQAR